MRRVIGNLPLLVPGGGAGGDIKSVLKMGLDVEGHGLCVSSSRSIIYAGTGLIMRRRPLSPQRIYATKSMKRVGPVACLDK